MKKNYKIIPILLFILCCCSCTSNQPNDKTEKEEALFFNIKNPTNQEWVGEVISVPVSILQQENEKLDWAKIGFSIDTNLPYQLIDEDKNNIPEEILLLVDLKGNEEKKVNVNFSNVKGTSEFAKKTQAEISHKTGGKWEGKEYKEGTFKNVNSLNVPPEHTDHSWFIRYEGPGWESDKVGYRFYLDWRNAVDIFGKKTSDMVLQDVGQDGFDSYHEPSEWGMDVLKVAGSLGIGSIGFWGDEKATRIEKTDSLYCEILQNDNLQSKIRTQYYGWQINDQKLDLTSDLTIQAGSRLTRQDIVMSNPLPNICTGIVKLENVDLMQNIPTSNKEWGYIATYGPQSLAKDNLGMAVFFKMENVPQIAEDKESHVVVLQPTGNKLTYYFAAAWEQESNGIKTIEDFKNYLNGQLEKLNQPIMVSK
ncbi:MAG: DUF4861 domain-containing protein [Chitinophagales bacterium]